MRENNFSGVLEGQQVTGPLFFNQLTLPNADFAIGWPGVLTTPPLLVSLNTGDHVLTLPEITVARTTGLWGANESTGGIEDLHPRAPLGCTFIFVNAGSDTITVKDDHSTPNTIVAVPAGKFAIITLIQDSATPTYSWKAIVDTTA